MGVLPEQHSFEGSGTRKQLTIICCLSGGTIARHQCFCSGYLKYHFLPDSPIHQLCSRLLLLLHSRSLLAKSASTCPLFNHATTSDEDIFYLTSRLFFFFFINDGKKKNKATHSLLNSAQKILH